MATRCPQQKKTFPRTGAHPAMPLTRANLKLTPPIQLRPTPAPRNGGSHIYRHCTSCAVRVGQGESQSPTSPSDLRPWIHLKSCRRLPSYESTIEPTIYPWQIPRHLHRIDTTRTSHLHRFLTIRTMHRLRKVQLRAWMNPERSRINWIQLPNNLRQFAMFKVRWIGCSIFGPPYMMNPPHLMCLRPLFRVLVRSLREKHNR